MSRSRSRRLAAALATVTLASLGVFVTSPASGAASLAPDAGDPSAEAAIGAVGADDAAEARAAAREDARRGRFARVQLLSFNDFHGNLEPPAGSSGRIITDHTLTNGAPTDVTVDAGGVEYLATHLAQAREGQRYSLTVAAGDLIGATPLLSAAFHDEPTIESLNLLGLDVSAVGNHEFDEGYRELQRMARGGCLDDGDGADNQNSCPTGSFAGADFDYLAANVRYAGTKRTILPPYAIKRLDGMAIGFIGMTLKETPSIVTASGVAGLEFTDEVATANALVPELRRKGVKAIVVLIHQGGVPGQQTWVSPDGTPYQVNPTYDYTCAQGGALQPTSPILSIAQRLDPEIDMVISGHTHQPYVCDVPDPDGRSRLVTSASSFGRLFTETMLTYDRRRDEIIRASIAASNTVVTRTVTKDAAQTALIARYNELVRPIASTIIGSITADVTRTGNPAGESPLGDLVADAQLADPSVVVDGQTPVVAFMNPGGLRTDLVYAASKYGEPPGDITYEEAFAVQPFNNYLVSMTLTGADVYALLTEQVTGGNAGTGKKTLQVSEGFTYEMTPTGPVPGSVRLGGVPVELTGSYRVVTNSFLADGGDNFATFRNGTARHFGGLDIDAFAAYLSAHSPYTPLVPTRITGTR